MIELRQFRQFIAVAEELSFRRAAARLHMAQPPLTAAIRKMEDELGVLLFERGNRIARITKAGQVFLEEARRAVTQAERAIRVTKQAAAGLSGSLRISFIDTAANGLLPDILRAFRAQCADVELELVEATTVDQLIAIQRDQVDVGLVVLPVLGEGGLRIEPAMHDRLVAALPAAHPLAEQPTLALGDLAAEPWLLFPHRFGPGMHNRILKACALAGFIPRVVQEVRLMQTIIGLVAGGVGVAVVPRQLMLARPHGVVFRELAGLGTPIPYDLALAYQSAQSVVCDTFVTIAHSVLRAV